MAERKHNKKTVRKARYLYGRSPNMWLGGRGAKSFGSTTKGGHRSGEARQRLAQGLKAVRAARRRESSNPIARRGFTSVQANIGKNTPPGLKGVSVFKFGGVPKISRLSEPHRAKARGDRRAANKKAWATRKKLYGKSGAGKKGAKKKAKKR